VIATVIDSKTPRERLLVQLTDALRDVMLAGELHAARIAHEALGKLLDAPGGDKATVAEVRELSTSSLAQQRRISGVMYTSAKCTRAFILITLKATSGIR
jgi:hypothetical protein